jgi:hypothetical protein
VGLGVRALAAVRRFSLVLLKQGAVLPQVVNLNNDRYRISWQPALLKEEVQQLVKLLSGILPPDVLRVQIPEKKDKFTEKFFDPRGQVSELVGLFITAFINHHHHSDRGEHR